MLLSGASERRHRAVASKQLSVPSPEHQQMSERRKTHNGRDVDGHFKVKQADVEDTLQDPAGPDFIRDDVRLGGAVADTGPQAGASGEKVERLIDQNRYEVDHLVGRDRDSDSPNKKRRSGKDRGSH
jgi:hypothetical protein